MKEKKRVVITGLGIFSPLGIGANAYWRNLLRGVFPIKKINLFPTKEFKCKYAFQIGHFDFNRYFRDLNSEYIPRSTKFLLIAVKTALKDSNLSDGLYNNEDIGIFTSTIYGSCGTSCDFYRNILLKGPDSVNPMAFPPALINYPSNYLGIINNFRGPNLTFSSGFHAGLEAINFASNSIKQNFIKIAVVSGVNDLGIENYAQLSLKRLLGRNGFILGENSSTLILENMANAKKRQAKMYAEILGYSTNFSRDVNGYAQVIEEAIENSNLAAKDIDLCMLSANGIRNIDLMELNAIKRVFKVNLDKIDLIAIKENSGECEGASGILQALTAAKAIKKKKTIRNVLINSFSMEGNNAVLVIKKTE